MNSESELRLDIGVGSLLYVNHEYEEWESGKMRFISVIQEQGFSDFFESLYFTSLASVTSNTSMSLRTEQNFPTH